MAQGPFSLNLVWESQYFGTAFILTRIEIEAVHEVQLAEVQLATRCRGRGLYVLNPPKPGLVGVCHLHTEPQEPQKLWGALGERTPPLFPL